MMRNPNTPSRLDYDLPRKAHTILTIDNWIIWDYADSEDGAWSQYAMFHRCGLEQHHGVNQILSGKYACSRCVANPPDGLVAVYELMNWETR